MAQVCLVCESGGDYDSRYDNVILAFETLQEGEEAVRLIELEMEAIYKLPTGDQLFNERWTHGSHRAEDRAPMWEQARLDHEASVRAACQVYPCVFKREDREVFSVPDKRDDPTFHAYMIDISVLASLQKTG